MLIINTYQKHNRAFTLMEVILAAGILAFAVLCLTAIILNQLNALSRAADSNGSAALMAEIDCYVQSRPFSEVCDWVKGGQRKALLAVAANNINSAAIIDPEKMELGAIVAQTTGRTLYKIVIGNAGIQKEIPPADASLFNEGYLALAVQIYFLPASETLIADSNFQNACFSVAPEVLENQELSAVFYTAKNR